MKYSLPEYSPLNNPNEEDSNSNAKSSLKAAPRKGIPNYTTNLPNNSTGYYYKPFTNPYYSDMVYNMSHPYPDFSNLQEKPRTTTPVFSDTTVPITQLPVSNNNQQPDTQTPGTPMPGTPGTGTPQSPGNQIPSAPRTTTPIPRITTPGTTSPTTPGTIPRTITPGATPATPGMTTPGTTTPGASPATPGVTTPGTAPGTAPRTTMPGTTPRTTTPGTTPATPGMTVPTTPGMPMTQGWNYTTNFQSSKKPSPSYQQSYFDYAGNNNFDYSYTPYANYKNNELYVTDNNSYRIPMGVPMMPLYGYDNCDDADKDLDYMKQLYPPIAKKLLADIEDECDKLEYDGSCMFDEYPDRVYLGRIVDRIYTKYRYLEEDEDVNAESISPSKVCDNQDTKSIKSNQYGTDRNYRRDRFDSRRTRPRWLRDLIEVLLFNEILNRRRRYRSRRRWF